MWTDVKNKSKTAINNGNSSKMIDADLLTRHLLHTVQQRNGSTAAVTHPSRTEGSSTRTSGIIPGKPHWDQSLYRPYKTWFIRRVRNCDFPHNTSMKYTSVSVSISTFCVLVTSHICSLLIIWTSYWRTFAFWWPREPLFAWGGHRLQCAPISTCVEVFHCESMQMQGQTGSWISKFCFYANPLYQTRHLERAMKFLRCQQWSVI